ncbi:MAG TPA: TRAP transporter substrate-binding protein, partial [Rubrivivax sp.]|nr:TRAP transporter substrate-binding protein [Rubrivivax sp.]
MKLFRRTLIATLAAAAATTLLPLAAQAQDIKPRIIRFGY